MIKQYKIGNRNAVDNKSENGWDGRGVECLHNIVLDVICSGILNGVGGISIFIACESFDKERNEESSFRFLTGTDMSPTMAVMMYFIPCVVVMQVYGRGRGMGKEVRGAGVGWKYKPGTVNGNWDGGATYIQFCKDMFNHLRYSEMSHVRFVVCRNHERSGISYCHKLNVKNLGGS